MPTLLRRDYGVAEVEVRQLELLHSSCQAGHGVMLCPNHCRPSDPFLFSAVSVQLARPVHIMASWHLFMQGRLQRYLLQRVGAFSMHREITDWRSLRCAEDILCEARHPLLVFPEGITSRTNDHLNAFMRGPAHLARRAARRRAGQGGRVVIHPVGIRYFFEGDLAGAAQPRLEEVEARIGVPSPGHLPLRERILHTGTALLARKEVQYFGAPQSGPLALRIRNLLEHVLAPLEAEWLRRPRGGDVMARVKAVRAAIVPGLADKATPAPDRDRRWRHLSDLYLVQQLHCYPAGYLDGGPPDRLLEIVEHFEEDLTDRVRPHQPLRAIVVIGEPIEIPPVRAPQPRHDPLMGVLRERIEALLASSLQHRRPAACALHP
jgi:1-acyl-sn-glycerol-3-phosphate acyltransferase